MSRRSSYEKSGRLRQAAGWGLMALGAFGIFGSANGYWNHFIDSRYCVSAASNPNSCIRQDDPNYDMKTAELGPLVGSIGITVGGLLLAISARMGGNLDAQPPDPAREPLPNEAAVYQLDLYRRKEALEVADQERYAA